MRKLISNILKEEAKIFEVMGVKLSKVKSALPSQYLVKTTKKQEKLSAEKRRLKTITNKVNSLYTQIDKELKNLKWEDLYLSPREDFFFVILPKKIKNKISKLNDNFQELYNNDYTDLLVPKEKIEQLVEDFRTFINDDFIYVYVDPPRNRTHFPKGLPKALLGYDLGIKIYRNLLTKIDFIQSEPNASPSVQAIYRRLLELPEVNAVVYTDLVLVINKEIGKEQKIKILRESIYERYKMKPNRRLILNKTIIMDSSLKREIGEKKILNMIEELFLESRRYEHEPFSEIGYVPKSHQISKGDGTVYLRIPRVNEAIGFRASYMKPDINAIINFSAPDADKDLKPILEDILKRNNIKVYSISVGTGKNKNCRLDLGFFNEREIQHLIDDLHRELMVVHSVRIQDVTHYIK